MNPTTRFLVLLAAFGFLLLTGNPCFSEEGERVVQVDSEADAPAQVADNDFDKEAFDNGIIWIDHEDYVMGMDGYYESLVENKA